MQYFVETDAPRTPVASSAAHRGLASAGHGFESTGHQRPTGEPTDAASEELDALAQLARADAADASLLRLVLTAAGAALLLALASSLASVPV